jgi:hypothetical protein
MRRGQGSEKSVMRAEAIRFHTAIEKNSCGGVMARHSFARFFSAHLGSLLIHVHRVAGMREAAEAIASHAAWIAIGEHGKRQRQQHGNQEDGPGSPHRYQATTLNECLPEVCF